MLISHSRPSDIAWSLIGTGAAWLTDADVLTNGRPAAAARLQWLSGTQTTASVLTLRGTWTTACAPRVVALLGLTLPVGTLITLAFRRPADADYTYLADLPSQRVVQLPDGSRCAWFALDAGLDPVIGVEYRIHNDVNGSASIAAGSAIDIGEAWVGPTFEVCLRRSMQDHVIDPTAKRRSYGSQTFASQRLPYRSIQLELVPQRDTAIGDVRALRGQVMQAERMAIVPDETDVYGTALFGTAYQFDLAALDAGKFWSAVFQADEEPATPVP
ncbi:MAG: hypothetical protein J0H50_09270 [Xanthomonadales bacterium]|nr:hypothetical protein [Xanthomonadales bacterium]